MKRGKVKKEVLKIRRMKFAKELLKTGNKAEAARRSGYSKKNAKQAGYKLAKAPRVKKYINEKLSRYDVTAENVLSETAANAKSRITDYLICKGNGKFRWDINPSRLSDQQLAAIKDVYIDKKTGRVRGVVLHDKTENIALLGKHLKLFSEKIELTGELNLADVINEARKRADASEGAEKKSKK